MAFLISPCKKIVYCPIFKTLSTSISTYFKQHGWSEIINRSITNDHIKLVFMRHPIDRLASALNYIRCRSNLSNDIITQMLKCLSQHNGASDSEFLYKFEKNGSISIFIK